MKYLNAKTILIFLAIFIVLNNLFFSPSNILSWDVFGYYLYLPLTFIYNDLGLNNETIIHQIMEKYQNTATFYQAMKMPDGHYVMKYTMGLSVLYAPFFLIGHLLAQLFQYPADGFSLVYQYSIFAGGIIYAILGIVFLYRVLLNFFSDKITGLILLITVFATNYLVHITMYGQNAMSHNHLFLAYSLILFWTIKWHKTFRIRHIIFLAFTCGFTILSRPSEFVCLAIPLLWGVYNKSTLLKKLNLLFKYKVQIIFFAVILIAIAMPQFIYWKIFTGKFLFNSFGGNAGEGFEFLHPYLLQVLFSFRKGWLIYTPVMILALAGFYFIYKRNRQIFFPLFIYFIVNLYLVSSWSCWWYAQSFSQRALIPSYPVLAIALGYFFVWLNERRKTASFSVYFLIIIFIYLNLFQTWQFHHGIIHADRMTKSYYFRVFGRTFVSEDDKKLLLVNRSFSGIESFENEEEYNFKTLEKLDFETALKKDSTQAYSGEYSFRLDTCKIYSPAIEYSYQVITKQDHAWIRVTAMVYPTDDIISHPFSLVVHFNHNAYPYKYKTFDSEQMSLELNAWNKISFDYLTPEVRNKSDRLKIYLWLRGNQKVFIDDLEVAVYEMTLKE
jgi:hypothetical protein